ncbi:glycosyltransferase family 4 protein [Actinomadura sp. ATCC 31491]|uniref:Glycosyltransferase family 4 protein n=1 Tax=Actinomadura luzonensis TaxID=2805427 RepID=A0ABT0FWA5_9ACTN|nr:glycosyltransferase family 4 protein [Actinomadura luzonensis]MCK2216620.1 glycosyltransferase family 4 protein [Actinomadura luzonensis]
MRVAFVLGTTSGGTGRHVRMLAEGLTRRGHRVLVAGPRSVEEQFAFGAVGARFAEVSVSDRPHPANDLRAVLAIRRVTRNADVVHAHGLRAGALAALGALGAWRRRRRTLVVTLHNALTAGGFVGFVYGVLERIVARRADRVLVVSPDLGERMTRLGARDVRAAVVPAPPLRPAGRTPQEVADELGAGERPILLTIARLAQQKGLETLLDVAAGPWNGTREEGEAAPRQHGSLEREDAGPAVAGSGMAGLQGTGLGRAEREAVGSEAASGPEELRSAGLRPEENAGGTGAGAAQSGAVRAGAADPGTVGSEAEGPQGAGSAAAGGAVGSEAADSGAGAVRAEAVRGGGVGGRGMERGSGRGWPLFVIAGEGPLRGELERRIAAEGLPVKLLGNRDDVPDLLGAATAVVTAARWEGQPLSIREALMAGKPVIATAVGGIPEIVGDAGILAPYGDVHALREAVRTLLEEPGTAERLAAAAVRRGREMPGGDDAVESVLGVYGASRSTG